MISFPAVARIGDVTFCLPPFSGEIYESGDGIELELRAYRLEGGDFDSAGGWGRYPSRSQAG